MREELGEPLRGISNVLLTEPLGYAAFARLLGARDLVITDSGGIQEEAPSLGKPVLVTRETTERAEGVEAGTLLLVGTDPDRIAREGDRLLDDPSRLRRDGATRRTPTATATPPSASSPRSSTCVCGGERAARRSAPASTARGDRRRRLRGRLDPRAEARAVAERERRPTSRTGRRARLSWPD